MSSAINCQINLLPIFCSNPDLKEFANDPDVRTKIIHCVEKGPIPKEDGDFLLLYAFRNVSQF